MSGTNDDGYAHDEEGQEYDGEIQVKRDVDAEGDPESTHDYAQDNSSEYYSLQISNPFSYLFDDESSHRKR